MTTLRSTPFRVVFQQFNVKAVQAACSPDVKGVFADLPNSADTCQWQKETEVIGKVFKGTSDSLAADEVFSFEVFSICGEDEFGLGLACCRAGLE